MKTKAETEGNKYHAIRSYLDPETGETMVSICGSAYWSTRSEVYRENLLRQCLVELREHNTSNLEYYTPGFFLNLVAGACRVKDWKSDEELPPTTLGETADA